MAEHTPGPWAWEYADQDCRRPIALVGPDEDVLTATGDGSTTWADVAEPDARLIAAAPELLAACQRAYEVLAELRLAASLEPQGSRLASLVAAAAAATEPLAKALGRAAGWPTD